MKQNYKMICAMQLLLDMCYESQEEHVKDKDLLSPQAWINDFCTVNLRTARCQGHTKSALYMSNLMPMMYIAPTLRQMENIKKDYEYKKENVTFATINTNDASFFLEARPHELVVFDPYTSLKMFKNSHTEDLLFKIAHYGYKQSKFVLMNLA